MPFNTDYDSFRSFVGVWLDVSGLASGTLDSIITNAEKRIERGDGTPQEPGLRVREMETAFAWTITGSGTISVPSDFIELKSARIDSSPVVKLEKKSVEFIYSKYPYRGSNLGKPQFIAREASNFIFGPHPDSTYTVKGVYYKRRSSMPTAGTINGVFTAYPDLYLKAAVLEGEKFIGRDQRTAVWEPDFKRQLQSANKQNENEEYSGGSLRVTASGPGFP
jgi:hypothetical protein